MRSLNFLKTHKLFAGFLALVLVAGMTSPAFAQVAGVDETVEDIPLEGFSDYNHLSVRSAAAIVFDRWLGASPEKV